MVFNNNPGRALTYPWIVRQEISELADSAGGFVEFENRLGKVWRVGWDGGWFVSGERLGELLGERASVRSAVQGWREMSLDEVLGLFEGALWEGAHVSNGCPSYGVIAPSLVA
ncbi:hypothetical protein [Streptomyces sp. SID12488]|uniref:hypothetical protein n=1 Tax=Streptomyces sp. SID12488 TaxID=2706040 RepID=UPI0019446283|nr:hypothetical protein [Streptomyces sp. SID12488]